MRVAPQQKEPVKVTIIDGVITITVAAESQPRLSSTGKSHLLASTQGFFKSDATWNGKPVSVSLNVIVPTREGTRPPQRPRPEDYFE